jgi:diamine N-acetyltransferase
VSDLQRGALVPIDESNWRAALDVRVRDDQLPFVADHQPIALVVLAKAYVRPGGRNWEPLAFDIGGRIVAIVALAYRHGVGELANLSVDADYQRRGVGSAVLSAACDRARSLGLRALELTVHSSNESALMLYRRAGFSPTGDAREGERVWRMQLEDDQ